MIKTNDELGISSSSYQKAAEMCVRNFLENFEPSAKNRKLALPNDANTPFEIRVRKNPPSVQIRHFPKGGIKAGQLRICEKISLPQEDFEEICEGKLLLPKTPLILADEADLTRESIILTLGDNTISEMLKQEFIAPKQATEILENTRRGHPDFFIIVQRYLMGIEYGDGLKIPYGIIAETDSDTLEYLTKLPAQLGM